MNHRREELSIGNNGHILRATLEIPSIDEEKKCPLAIIMHGMAMHRNSRMFREISDALLRSGIATLRFDFNGHGESFGRQEDMTIPNQVEDAEKIMDYVKTLPFITKTILIGHSQGAVVASLLAGPGSLYKEDIDSLIVIAPGYRIEEEVKKGQLGNVKLDLDQMEDRVRVLHWDYFIGKEFFRTLYELEINEDTIHFDGPVCAILGTKDEFIPKENMEKYIVCFPNRSTYYIEGANHVFWGKLDELNDKIRDFLLIHC